MKSSHCKEKSTLIRRHCAGLLCAPRATTGWPRWRVIVRGTFFNGTLLPRPFQQIVSFLPPGAHRSG